MRLRELYAFPERVYDGDKQHKWGDLFGVEMEIEDPSIIQNTKYWYTKEDGSLRNGIEYILIDPQGGTKLEEAISEFYNIGCKFTNGPRTSTHIHVNVGDMNLDQLRVMVAIMYTIEDGLFSVIGELRKWAGYAMPLSEMDPYRLRTMLSSKDYNELVGAISPNRNQERYYGFNTCVRKHGTVEFRYFPGGPTKQELCDWVDLAAAVKRGAMASTTDSILNVGNNSQELENWLRTFLPDSWYNRLRNAVGLDAMLDKFLEVTAQMPEPEGIVRREQLVFATKPLITYMRKMFGEKGAAYFDNIVKQATVFGSGDWQEYLARAWEADRQSDKAEQPKKKGAEYGRWRDPDDDDGEFLQNFDDEPAVEAPNAVAEQAPVRFDFAALQQAQHDNYQRALEALRAREVERQAERDRVAVEARREREREMMRRYAAADIFADPVAPPRPAAPRPAPPARPNPFALNQARGRR